MSQLIIVLAIYFSLYGSAHLYFLIKARRAYYLQGVRYVLLSAVLLFLLLAPIQGRLLEAQGHLWTAAIITWIGFGWMGFLFLFLCLSLPLDLYHLGMVAGQRITGKDWTGLMLSRRQNIALAATLAVGLTLYGTYEAYQLETKTVTLRSKKIPAETGRIRIVQLSDLHLGLMSYPGRVSRVVQAVEAARPDLLVSTGDLIDSHLFGANEIAASLKKIPTPLGKYAVAGNHETYMKDRSAENFIKAAGFTLMENEAVALEQPIAIIGIDDPARNRSTVRSKKTESELLGDLPADTYRVLLKHRPEIENDSKGLFDLQLSGHTHSGQIFPFGLLLSLRYPIGQGLNALPDAGHIYVSRGTGTWGPPLRLLAPPEITRIDIIALP